MSVRGVRQGRLAQSQRRNIHLVDDLTVDGQGGKGQVTENVLETAHDLIEACQNDPMIPIAKNKLAVVASDNGLANKIAKRLGSHK